MWLILTHDLLATAAAVVASFFIRFEGAGLAERWRFLTILLPVFVVYSGFVYRFFGLDKAKWRFTSLPELNNIFNNLSCEHILWLSTPVLPALSTRSWP